MKFVKDRLAGFSRYKNLLKQLVATDIKLKYRRSVLGYLWSVLNPLLIMLVMTAVFSYMFRFDIPNFPVYLLTGNILFTFFSESTNMGMTSIVSNASLIKKTYIPKYIFTLSKVTSSLVTLLFSMAALLIVMIITGTKFTLLVLLAPLVLLQLYVFSLGVSMFLSSMAVFFRDMQYLWGVIITAWMYMTPIFYPESTWPAAYAFYFKALNPLYSYIRQFRDVMMYGALPSAAIIGAGIGYALIAVILGTIVFYKGQDRFILYI